MQVQFYNKKNYKLYNFTASGRKIVAVGSKRTNLNVTNKSQTLPRNLGSKAIASTSGYRVNNKPATATPPVIRKQIGNNVINFKHFNYFVNIVFFLIRPEEVHHRHVRGPL